MDTYSEKLIQMAKEILDMQERKELKSIEDAIYSSDESLKKIIAFQKCQEAYFQALEYSIEKKEECKNQLIHSKKIMDDDILIKKYNELYEIVTEPTLYLEKELHKTLGGRGKC